MTFTLCNYLCNIEVQVDPFETLLVIRLPDFFGKVNWKCINKILIKRILLNR